MAPEAPIALGFRGHPFHDPFHGLWAAAALHRAATRNLAACSLTRQRPPIAAVDGLLVARQLRLAGRWPDLPAVAPALAYLGTGVIGLDSGQLGDDLLDRRTGARTAIGPGGGGGGPFGGPWRACRTASRTAATPLAYRGQARHGPPVT